ncbi:MAG TPA: IS110 family transposase [Elusimicrobia bacterium]|nr:IS110 family transposase [Elusimicrobiota bacterium]
MSTVQSHTKFVPNDYDVFAGLDVDKKSISVTFLEHSGQMKQIKMPYDSHQLMSYVRNRYTGKKVAFVYESGPTGFGLYDDLTSAKYFCMVTSASKVPTEPSNRVKTNRIDSKKLSENLRGGQLKEIHVPTEHYRELRHLVQLRDTFVKQLKSTKLRIKSLLLVKGIPFPDDEHKWSYSTIRKLKDTNCSEAIKFHLDRLILSLEFFRSNVLDTTRNIRAFCKHNEEINRNIQFLISIPGIGFITASQLLARIGDWRKLYRFDQIGSFLGLVPSEHSTGDDVCRGSITRTGNTNLRCKLIQCAWKAIQIDPQLNKFYNTIYNRNRNDYGEIKAITAVARKLTTRIYAVLTQQRNYKLRNKPEDN